MKSAKMLSAIPAEPIRVLAANAGISGVLAFPTRALGQGARMVHRFSMRDRITALDWACSDQSVGHSRLVFEAAEDIGDSETGEFLLVYADGAAWASWGIGCGALGMTLWHSARGTTIGRFDTLSEALDRIHALCV